MFLGVLKNRFRCLLKDRVLHYDPLKAGQIINAVCVLHNMCVTANLDLDNDEQFEEDNIDIADDDVPPRNILREGQERRANIIQLYFNN